jgi:hypothetical protein
MKNIGVPVLMYLQVQRKDCEDKLRQYEERTVAAEKAQKTAEEAAKIRYCGQCGTGTLLYGTVRYLTVRYGTVPT